MSLAPFFIGLAGSIHCIGMCGPLASLAAGTGYKSLWKRGVYNAGRILTYGLMGALLSYAGAVSSLWGAQKILSIVVGSFFLVIGITGLQVAPRLLLNILRPLSEVLKARFSIILGMKNPVGVFTLGAINGLLPCGMTWLALAYCVTLQWPLDGFLAMLTFGAGTLPVMLGFPTFINRVMPRFKLRFQTVQTILLIVSGCLLIARTFIHDPSSNKHGESGIVVCGSHQSLQP